MALHIFILLLLLFGKDGTRSEEVSLIKVNGKWG